MLLKTLNKKLGYKQYLYLHKFIAVRETSIRVYMNKTFKKMFEKYSLDL